MGKRAGVKTAAGAAVALGLLLGGLLGPAPAGAQMQRPGPSGGGYHSVPAPSWSGERHWRDGGHGGWDRGRGGHGGWGRDRWGHDGHGRPGWHRPHYGGWWGPGPAYRPGQWLWNGWGWVWAPAY